MITTNIHLASKMKTPTSVTGTEPRTNEIGAEHSTSEIGVEPENAYLDLLRELLLARPKANRTGVNTRSVFSRVLKFNLFRKGMRILPLLTTKRVPFTSVAHELLWFIKGSSNTTYLNANGVKIWDKNSTPEFLASRGLDNYKTGECGPIYGYQWRNWGRQYIPIVFRDHNINYSSLITTADIIFAIAFIVNILIAIGQYQFDEANPQKYVSNGQIVLVLFTTLLSFYTWVLATLRLRQYMRDRDDEMLADIRASNGHVAQGIDQLSNAISLLKNDPFSRRIIVSAWNPRQLSEMALPPCHLMYQFTVDCGPSGERRLNCAVTMRSADVALGVPFNIASYALLTHMVAQMIPDMVPGELSIHMIDCHIYENHIDGINEQLTRVPKTPPTLKFTRPVGVAASHDFSIDEYTYADFDVKNYNYYPYIKYPMN